MRNKKTLILGTISLVAVFTVIIFLIMPNFILSVVTPDINLKGENFDGIHLNQSINELEVDEITEDNRNPNFYHLSNGMRVESGYKLDVVIKKDTLTFTIYMDDFKMAQIITNYRVVSDSEVGPFVYASLGMKGVIVVEQDKETKTKINDLYEYVLTTYAGAKEVATLTTDLEYKSLGSDNAYEVCEHINGNYYKYDTEIIVTTFEEEAKETEADKHVVITTEKTSVMDEIKDKVDEWVDEFKDKFENNKAFKTASILLGTVLGILLLWGIVKIFKKIFRWLGR